jgi:hypothetical protein
MKSSTLLSPAKCYLLDNVAHRLAPCSPALIWLVLLFLVITLANIIVIIICAYFLPLNASSAYYH